MTDDERSIRVLLDTWHRATAAGDVEAVLPLMAEDVVFLTPGQPPMRGRQGFGTGLRRLLESHRIVSSGEIQELEVIGDRAWCWSRLTVAITPNAGGSPVRRSGSALSVLRREPGGRWVLFRDANLLAPESA